MKIYREITWHWDEVQQQYVLDFEDSYVYNGEIGLCCGASQQEKDAQAAQASFFTQMTDQSKQIFGQSSQVFQSLQNTFAPTVAAGPSQKGFSAAEEANLKSQAITQGGIAARNASQATKEAIAAQGGGNNPALQSGVNTGIELSVNNAAANNTATNLSNINEANYETGRKNYDTAVAGLSGSTNVFNPATAAGNAATNAGSASASTAADISRQNSSWVQAVTGALGGVAGTVASGGMSNLGKGLKFFGGSGSGTGTGATTG